MEADEACSETAGQRTVFPRHREGNDDFIAAEAAGSRLSDAPLGTANRKSVPVSSTTPVFASIITKCKDDKYLFMSHDSEDARVGLSGLAAGLKRDAKRDAATRDDGFTGAPAYAPGTCTIKCDEEIMGDVAQHLVLRSRSPLHCSTPRQQPWSRAPQVLGGPAAMHAAMGPSSAANKKRASACDGGGGTLRSSATAGGGGCGCKEEPRKMEGLLLAAAAAAVAAGMLCEPSAAPSEGKELGLLRSAPPHQSHFSAMPPPRSVAHVPAGNAAAQDARAATSTAACDTAAGGRIAGIGGTWAGPAGRPTTAPTIAARILPGDVVRPSRGLEPPGQKEGGAAGRCSGTVGSNGPQVVLSPRAQQQHEQQQAQQQHLPSSAHKRQATLTAERSPSEGWRSRHPPQPQPSYASSMPPHGAVGGAAGGGGRSGAGGTAKGSSATYASPTGGAGAAGTDAAAAAAAVASVPTAGAVRSKGVLSPKVPVIMPRQFAERVMDPATILKYGITVVVRRVGQLPPGKAPSLPASSSGGAAAGGNGGSEAAEGWAGGTGDVNPDLVLTAQVEQFFHAQGYSQYRVLGLKEISCGYHNWRIEMWEALGDRTVRLTICAPTQAAKAAAPLQLPPAGPSQALAGASGRGTAGAAEAAVAAAAAASPTGPAAGTLPPGGSQLRRGSLVAEAGGSAEAGGGAEAGDDPRGRHRGAAPLELADVVRRDAGLECTEEVGEEDLDDGGGAASAAAAPLELELGRGAHLLAAAAAVAAAGRAGRQGSGGGGYAGSGRGRSSATTVATAVSPGSGSGSGARRPRGGSTGPTNTVGNGRASVSVLGVKREAEAEADAGAASGAEELDAGTPSTTTPRGAHGGGGHKMMRTSAGGGRTVRGAGGGAVGGGGTDNVSLQEAPGQGQGQGPSPGPELIRSARGAGEGATRQPRRSAKSAGGWRDPSGGGGGGGGGGGAFGGYSSLPAEDMPPELPGALASSPHPCRKGGATVLSPEHFIHLPRLFFQDNFDTAAVLAGGLRVQVQAGNVIDPVTTTVSVASYQNHTGYRYYRLLGFKDVPRRYAGWRVAAWDKVAPDMVRIRLSAPLGVPLRVALNRAAQLGAASGGSYVLPPPLAEDASNNFAGTCAAASAPAADADAADTKRAAAAVAGGGSLLPPPPPRRQPSGPGEGVANGRRFSSASAGLRDEPAEEEEEEENEEDRAAGLAMMDLGRDLKECPLPVPEPDERPGHTAVAAAAAAVKTAGEPIDDGASGGQAGMRAPPPSWLAAGPAGFGRLSDARAPLHLRRGGSISGAGGGHVQEDEEADTVSGDATGLGPSDKPTLRTSLPVHNDDDDVGDSGASGGAAAAARRRAAAAPRRPWAMACKPTALERDAGAQAPGPQRPGHATQQSIGQPGAVGAASGAGAGVGTAGGGSIFRHVAPSAAEVRRIMEAGVAAAVARLEVPSSRVRSVVSQNQSVVRPDKGRVYLQKPFVESSLAVTGTPLPVQVVINSGGNLDPATYPTKVTLSSSGAHGKAEYLLRLTAPMKHAHSGQVIVGWSALGRQNLMMHLAPGGRQGGGGGGGGEGGGGGCAAAAAMTPEPGAGPGLAAAAAQARAHARARARAGRLLATSRARAQQALAVAATAGGGGGGVDVEEHDGEEEEEDAIVGRHAEAVMEFGSEVEVHGAKGEGDPDGDAAAGSASEGGAASPRNGGGASVPPRHDLSQPPLQRQRQGPAALYPYGPLRSPPPGLRYPYPGCGPLVRSRVLPAQSSGGARQPWAPYGAPTAAALLSNRPGNPLLRRAPLWGQGHPPASEAPPVPPTSSRYQVQVLAADWPLAGAAATTAAAVTGAASPEDMSPEEQQLLLDMDDRSLLQPQLQLEDGDGDGSLPSPSPALMASVTRRPRSFRTQRPRQGLWAHPCCALSVAAPSSTSGGGGGGGAQLLSHPHSHPHQPRPPYPHRPRHVRKPSLPDSVLHAAEQLLHLSGHAVCSGGSCTSSSSGGAGDSAVAAVAVAAGRNGRGGQGDDDDANDDDDEVVDVHAPQGEGRCGAEKERDRKRSMDSGACEGGDGGGDFERGGKVGREPRGTGDVEAAAGARVAATAVALDMPLEVPVGAAAAGYRDRGSGRHPRAGDSGGPSERVEGVAAPSGTEACQQLPLHLQLQQHIQLQLQLQLQQHLKRQQQQHLQQQQQQNARWPEALARDGSDDEWAFRRRRAAVVAARRATAGGAPPSPSQLSEPHSHEPLQHQGLFRGGSEGGATDRGKCTVLDMGFERAAADAAARPVSVQSAGPGAFAPLGTPPSWERPGSACPAPPTTRAAVGQASASAASAAAGGVGVAGRDVSCAATYDTALPRPLSQPQPPPPSSSPPAAQAQSTHPVPPPPSLRLQEQSHQGTSQPRSPRSSPDVQPQLHHPKELPAAARPSGDGAATTSAAAGKEQGGEAGGVCSVAAAAAAATAGTQRVSFTRSSIDSSGGFGAGCGGFQGAPERPQSTSASPPYAHATLQQSQQPPKGQSPPAVIQPAPPQHQGQQQQQPHLRGGGGLLSHAATELGFSGAAPPSAATSAPAPTGHSGGAVVAAVAQPAASAYRAIHPTQAATQPYRAGATFAASNPPLADIGQARGQPVPASATAPPAKVGYPHTGQQAPAIVQGSSAAPFHSGGALGADADGGGSGAAQCGNAALATGEEVSPQRPSRGSFCSPTSSDRRPATERERDVGEAQWRGGQPVEAVSEFTDSGIHGRYLGSPRRPQEQQAQRRGSSRASDALTKGGEPPSPFNWPFAPGLPLPMSLSSFPLPLSNSVASVLAMGMGPMGPMGMPMASLGCALPSQPRLVCHPHGLQGLGQGPRHLAEHEQQEQEQSPPWPQSPWPPLHPWQHGWQQLQQQQQQQMQLHLRRREQPGPRGHGGAHGEMVSDEAGVHVSGDEAAPSGFPQRLQPLQHPPQQQPQQERQQGEHGQFAIPPRLARGREGPGRDPRQESSVKDQDVHLQQQQHHHHHHRHQIDGKPGEISAGARAAATSRPPVPACAAAADSGSAGVTAPPSAGAAAADTVYAQLQALLRSGAAAFPFASLPLLLFAAQQQHHQHQIQQQQQQERQQQQEQQQQAQGPGEPDHGQTDVQERGHSQVSPGSGLNGLSKSGGSPDGRKRDAEERSKARRRPSESQPQPHILPQSQAQPDARRAQADQAAAGTALAMAAAAIAATASGRDEAVIGADSCALPDKAAAGPYSQHLQQQPQPQQQQLQRQQSQRQSEEIMHPHPLPPPPQPPQPPQQQQQQQQQQLHTLEMDPQQRLARDLDEASGGAGGGGGYTIAAGLQLGLAGMGPALQHMMTQSRARQQATELTAAPSIGAATVAQTGSGQPPGSCGAGGRGGSAMSFGGWSAGLER